MEKINVNNKIKLYLMLMFGMIYCLDSIYITDPVVKNICKII